MPDQNIYRPTGVRAGLLKGRIKRHDDKHPANPVATPFYEAVEAASVDDLRWALNLLVKNPNAKRTYREIRINAIAYRLEELSRVDTSEVTP